MTPRERKYHADAKEHKQELRVMHSVLDKVFGQIIDRYRIFHEIANSKPIPNYPLGGLPNGVFYIDPRTDPNNLRNFDEPLKEISLSELVNDISEKFLPLKK